MSSHNKFFNLLSSLLLLYRIRFEGKGGAWCPQQPVAEDVYEWLQVDLGVLKIISMVETQGRFGNGQVRTL